MSDGAALIFDTYDEKIAQGLMRADREMGGLPGFLGVKIVEMGPGTLRAEAEVRDDLLTPFQSLHGGVLAGICDHVLGCVCYPLMCPGQWAATTEFKLNYLAAVSRGTLTAEASIVAKSRSTMVVRIDVANEGRLVCCAQGTVLVRKPRTPRGS